MPGSRAVACLCLCLAACAVCAAERASPQAAPAPPSGVLIEAAPAPPSLPLERRRVDRSRVVEQRLPDGTVLAHLDGEGRAHAGVLIGPDGARPVCGAAPAGAIDFRGRTGDGDDR